jgi:predicted metalloprotease
MFWKGREESENVEDRRCLSKITMVVGGGAGALIIAAVAMPLGADPQALLNQFQGNPQGGGQPAAVDPAQEEAAKFCKVILKDTEDVWVHHLERAKKKKILQAGDVESALTAANAIGDDALQKRAPGYVVPDSFTHGTSDQRVRWFRRGFETGDFSEAKLEKLFTAEEL